VSLEIDGRQPLGGPDDDPVPTTRTKACLRIGSTTGSATHITQTLGISPSRSHDIGQPRSPRDSRAWPNTHWALDSDLPDTSSLEDHLGRLCDQIEPHAGGLSRLADDGYNVDWLCFVEIENGQGGITLSPPLLQRLAALPAELDLDIYG
jgi:hypothetical protein